MIFFTLPNLHFNFHINQFIAFLAKEKPYLFKIPVTFSYVTGNFPYSCWNGRYNNNIGPFMDYDEINKFLSEYYDRYTGLYLKSKSFLKSINN